MSVTVVILAGQRPGPDALAEQAGVGFKADIPVCGKAMLDRVAEALDKAGLSRPFRLSGYPEAKDGFVGTDSGEGPADSALLACQGGPFPILLTTCDHALLNPEIVTEFLDGARQSNADFAVGLATQTRIHEDYPETKRTFLRFSDVAVSGCNLFYIANETGLNAIRFWQKAQHLRKKPLKMATQIGPKIAIRYALGRLSLNDAFGFASRKIDAQVAPIIIDVSEAAIDVDCPDDLALVESILRSRGQS